MEYGRTLYLKEFNEGDRHHGIKAGTEHSGYFSQYGAERQEPDYDLLGKRREVDWKDPLFR
jgi:hypothetical protein